MAKSQKDLSKKDQKVLQYQMRILGAIQGVLEEDDAEFLLEIRQDNNLTLFMHALANYVPSSFYNEITGNKLNLLEFNHLANQLCFQFMIKN
jgi:hypothetical protein